MMLSNNIPLGAIASRALTCWHGVQSEAPEVIVASPSVDRELIIVSSAYNTQTSGHVTVPVGRLRQPMDAYFGNLRRRVSLLACRVALNTVSAVFFL